MECEHQLQQVLDERSNVQDSLLKKENSAANLEADKQKLQTTIKNVGITIKHIVHKEQFYIFSA